MKSVIKQFLTLILCFTLILSVGCGDAPQMDDKAGDVKETVDRDAPIESEVSDVDSQTSMTYENAPLKNERLPQWSVSKLSRQNVSAEIPLLTRCYYPDYNELLKNLMTLRVALGKDVKTAGALSKFLFAYNAEASGLDLYLDYAKSTSVKVGGTVYGAEQKSIGGGKGYYDVPDGEFQFVVENEYDFYHALKDAKAGDIIYIPDNTVIDLSDWILAGDTVDFMTEGADLSRIQLDFTLPAGVTLLGARGYANSSGAILKSTSHANFVLTLEEGARVSGLVFRGGDVQMNASSDLENLSSGIRVLGDNAVIDNCEIAGFYNAAVVVENARGVKIKNNYIHHALGWDAGVGVCVSNGDAVLENNLFSQLRITLSASGKDSKIVYRNNVDAGNIRYASFVFEKTEQKDTEYSNVFASISQFVCQNNTFLSACPIFAFGGLPQSVKVSKNVFAYQESAYGNEVFSLSGVSCDVYANRVKIADNCYDVTAPYIASKIKDASGSSDARLSEYSKLLKDGLEKFHVQKSSLPDVTFTNTIFPDVLSNAYFDDDDDTAFVRLNDLALMAKGSNVKVGGASLDALVCEIISLLGGYGNYYTLSDWITLKEKDVLYGASANDDNPFGSFSHQDLIYTAGDYTVRCLNDLIQASKLAKRGDVIFIPEDVAIDVSGGDGNENTIVLKSGVILASNRGFVHEDGRVSTGGVIYCSRVQSKSVLVLNEESRLSGISLCGPDPAQHNGLWERCFRGNTVGSGYQNGHTYLTNATPTVGVSIVGDNAEVENCEIAGFSGAAVTVGSNENGRPSEGVKIHHNYIHHNQMMGFGYGISHGHAYTEIYQNLFNFNRHSIAGSGFEDSGYIAHDNVEMGRANGHNFDMHGGKDRKDGTDVAGGYVIIYNNTFLSDTLPYILRGAPSEKQEFYSNVLYIPRTACADSQLVRERVTVGRNIWNISQNNKLSSVG